jgi:hypothetical protein
MLFGTGFGVAALLTYQTLYLPYYDSLTPSERCWSVSCREAAEQAAHGATAGPDRPD